MPRITKQIGGSKPQPKIPSLSNGSILGKAIPVGDLARAPWKILIYGLNRVGKTFLSCQFPKPLLLISFEPSLSGGAESVRYIEGVRYLQEGVHFKGSEQTLLLAREIAQSGAYTTVVVDSATSLQDLVLREIMGVEKLPEQLNFQAVSGDQYRYRSERTRDLLRPFIDMPLNTVILAKERDHNPPKEERVNERTGKVQPDMRARFLRGVQDKSYIAPDLGGATVGWLQDACEWICRLYLGEEMIEERTRVNGQEVITEHPTGKYVRYLRTTYHPNYAAGPRSSNPKNVPDEIVNPTYEKIEAMISGEPIPQD